MHRLLFRVIGSPQESWQQEAIDQYLERLQPFARLEVIELEEQHGGTADPDPNRVRLREANHLLKNIPAGAHLIALDSQGKSWPSEQFATHLDELGQRGQSIVFLIGGSWGLDESVLKKANETISFGKQTLPHILARIVLLEQLYRAESILKGKSYHK